MTYAKLSDLIIAGCKITGAGKGEYYSQHTGCACAIGAALVAVKGKGHWISDDLNAFVGYQIRHAESVDSLPKHEEFPTLASQIIHANDVLGLSYCNVAGC